VTQTSSGVKTFASQAVQTDEAKVGDWVDERLNQCEGRPVLAAQEVCGAEEGGLYGLLFVALSLR